MVSSSHAGHTVKGLQIFDDLEQCGRSFGQKCPRVNGAYIVWVVPLARQTWSRQVDESDPIHLWKTGVAAVCLAAVAGKARLDSGEDRGRPAQSNPSRIGGKGRCEAGSSNCHKSENGCRQGPGGGPLRRRLQPDALPPRPLDIHEAFSRSVLVLSWSHPSRGLDSREKFAVHRLRHVCLPRFG